ncbi:hypothetical protein D1007_43442 [Hordeum vulgare]|uniref:Pectinesterase inhibitor domain-containing protein n=1 Tax=Hordeum vulgare subsp. vulgare TaxID=112509 RepID=A0A8I6YN88_HORVV|nr:uncharacterized protein LOC123411799 [Hordeum vulgare subsp. vulgare]KAE8783140.1 hypothetical protein D1007_43442 [Hordeum vulgare]KAI4972700.1 hypothetical protein ZWY2020_003625 [Hordeum vulgare]
MKAILLLVFAFPFLGAAGERCPGVPSLPVEAACRKACGTKLMHDMCMDTLRGGFHPSPSIHIEVTEYALLAAHHALESYGATAAAASELLRNRSLAGDERAAYNTCLTEYSYAVQCMDHVAGDMLPRCRFAGLGEQYVHCVAYVEGCRDRLVWLKSSPLYTMNLVDRNKALLAYSIAQLLGSI